MHLSFAQYVDCTALKNLDDLFQECYHVSSITVNPQWNDTEASEVEAVPEGHIGFQTCSDGTFSLCFCEASQT